MANGHGGARPGAGRKRKDEEQKSKRLTVAALVKEFGSEEKAFEFAAKQIKDNARQSFNFFKLLVEYAYGKPKEVIELESDNNTPFDFGNLTNEELLILSKMYARKHTDTADKSD